MREVFLLNRKGRKGREEKKERRLSKGYEGIGENMGSISIGEFTIYCLGVSKCRKSVVGKLHLRQFQRILV